MYREDIKKIEPIDGGLRLVTKDGRTANLFFAEFERLKHASNDLRQNYRISFGGLRWEELDEDISFDSIFEPDNFPLKLSAALKPINVSEVAGTPVYIESFFDTVPALKKNKLAVNC